MPSRQETLNAYVGPGRRLTRRNAAVCSSARGRTRPPIPTHRSISRAEMRSLPTAAVTPRDGAAAPTRQPHPLAGDSLVL